MNLVRTVFDPAMLPIALWMLLLEAWVVYHIKTAFGRKKMTPPSSSG